MVSWTYKKMGGSTRAKKIKTKIEKTMEAFTAKVFPAFAK